MKHLDEGTLQAWLDMPRSGLEPSEVAEIVGHLDSCAECKGRLEVLGASDERVHALLAEGVDRGLTPPPFQAIVARAEELRGASDGSEAPVPGRADRGVRWRLQRMAWAASIVVAIGVGWMTNEIYRGGPPPAAELRAPAPDASDASDAPDAVGVEVGRQEEELAPEPAAEPPADADARASSAQPTVSGVVRSDDGQPLPAAQVYVDGSDVGVLSRDDGAYTLPVPPDAVDSSGVSIVAQRIGYRPETMEVAVAGDGQAVADFNLREEALVLDAVVVTGAAGAAQRRAIGNTVDSDEEASPTWAEASLAAAEQALGRAPFTVPGRPVLSVEIGEMAGGAQLVRVRQDSGEGTAVLTLVQGLDEPTRGTWPVPSEGVIASVRRDGLLVTGTSPLSDDALTRLLAELR